MHLVNRHSQQYGDYMSDTATPQNNKITVFEENAREYDRWYDDNLAMYRAELLAVKKEIPAEKIGLEVGVGTGRFASLLNIPFGVDPAETMAKMAQKKGIDAVCACAENLPFHNGSFDFVIFVTTLCFLADPLIALQEARRVLKEKGRIIIGFIDKDSVIGKQYQKHKEAHKFFKYANLEGITEVTDLLTNSGFHDFKFFQTLIRPMTITIEMPQPGYGKGSFIVVRGIKK